MGKRKERKALRLLARQQLEIEMSSVRDIRYRGIFTARGLRLFALMLMTISQLSGLAVMANTVNALFGRPILDDELASVCAYMVRLGQMSMPLMVIATVGTILNRQESFLNTILCYFVAALLVYLFTVFVLMDIIRDMLYGLPTEISVLQEAFDFLKDDRFAVDCLTNIFSRILPGDGTIDTDFLNRLLAALKVSYTIPDIQSLLEYLPDGMMLRETAMSAIEAAACADTGVMAQTVVDTVKTLVEYLPSGITDYYFETTVPKLMGLIAGRMNINIFWNLFTYSLFYFFITYTPATLSAGKRMLFRCCSIIPALWLSLSFIFSSQLRLISGLTFPVWFSALLTNAQPSVMVVFFLMVLLQKYQELEHDSDAEKVRWKLFRRTRMSSLQFSVFASATVCFVSLADWLLGKVALLAQMGFGKSAYMWMCVPLLMLYTYNKKPRFAIFDAAVPVYYVIHYLALVLLGISVIVTIPLTIAGYR